METADLIAFMADNRVEAEIVHLSEDTLTVEAAAAALGVQPDQIAKSILFLAEGEPRLVIASGTTRISYKHLAKDLGLSRKRIKLATPEQVLQYTGYAVGTVPPFGHKKQLTTLVEEGVLKQHVIHAGGGARNKLLRVSVAELLRITRASTVRLRSE